VAFTTSAAPADIVARYRPNAHAYVTKPTDLEQVDRTVPQSRNCYGSPSSCPGALRRPRYDRSAADPTAPPVSLRTPHFETEHLRVVHR
jgi:hypothetical protein